MLLSAQLLKMAQVLISAQLSLSVKCLAISYAMTYTRLLCELW